MNKIFIQLYKDKNKEFTELHIFESWMPDYNHLFHIYNEECIKNKIIEEIDRIKISSDSYFTEIDIYCDNEEIFYLKLKYGMSHSYFFDDDIIGTI